MNRLRGEINHFTDLSHIWWGAKTVAGQRRYDNKASLFLKICKPQKGAKVLEIGCGDGEFTKRIAKFGIQVIATDITPKVVEAGRKVLSKRRVKFKIENAEDLSFKDGIFDIVCGVSILHQLSVNKGLKEAYRVLKMGGRLFFTEPNLLNPQVFLGLHIPYLRKRMEFSPNETALLRWDIENKLRKVGFRKVMVRNYDFLHPKTPPKWIDFTQKASNFLEKTPLVKEISGSLLIWAQK